MAMQALVMGFGGTGAHVLTALKELTVLKHGRVPETIKFLLFDTIADWQPGMAVQIVGGGAEEKTAKSEDEAASLDPLKEYFQLSDFAPDLKKHVFDFLSQAGNPDAYPHLKSWLHAPWLSENVPPHQLAITIGAAQQRQIGRYAMFKNAERIVAHLRPIIRNLSDLAKGSDVNVWLITSTAGGTGAGCLIDAAYLTRLAAGDNINLKVTGVIVLPNVYANVFGISQGRAYSLLRELERVQEQGMPQGERYVDLRMHILVSSRVVYDREGQQVAAVKSRLFDDLFYLGSDCPTDERRKTFFTSVASAIDPYLDASSGPSLLEKAVNDNAAASAFGAARVYVPTETFAEIFAWEQVAEYIRRAAAPKEVGDRVERLYSGSEQDRSDKATEKFRGMLELFKQLLEQENKTTRAKADFARDELNAQRIVTVWYELTGGNRTPDEQATLLTYIEPAYSLTEPERPKDPKEWEPKTYKENAADKNGVKESQEESRQRFADALDNIKYRYTNPIGGERTFEKGRRHVFDTISRRLQKKVDDLFISELERQRGQFAQSESTPEQGTVLTQLFAEVTWMLSDNGPLRKAHKVIGEFVETIAKEQAERDNRYTQAQQELRSSKKSGMFDFGAWVESYQQAARNECTDYIGWYQKYELLKNMQELVLSVESRLRDWKRVLQQLFDALVLREARSEGEASALFTVSKTHLKDTLEMRLYRAARNRSALISFGSQPDPQMHGYQEELRNQSAKGRGAALLNNSHWEAGVTEKGPELTLRINEPGLGQQQFTPRDIRALPQVLFQFFHKPINERLSNTDVFDYLIWLRENQSIEPETVITLLNAEATTLINAGAVPEMRILIYRQPTGGNKRDLADSLALRLGSPEAVESNYSDRNAMVLVKMKKPSLNQIADIDDCQRDYFMLRGDQLNNNDAHDKKLRRAQVFHPFRQEMESWYIERFYSNKVSSINVPTLPPRVARLLEDPEMMQIFIHGIATKAVEPTANGWVWHGPSGDVMLTNQEDDPTADVIKAAVIFTLKQGEGRKDGRTPISREAARQSINQSVQTRNGTRDEILASFLQSEMDKFLDKHAPQSLREALKMIFTFYCDPKTRTALQLRVDLP
jgi:hypothetical protein